jgi:glucose-1-phosphate adenylyltransferase
LNINKNNSVVGVGKNITVSQENVNDDFTNGGTVNLSMDMFIISKNTLLYLINNCIKTGNWIDLRNCVYNNIMNLDVNAYEFKGYLSYINSIQSYYKANMDILNLEVSNDLFFTNGPIYTKIMDESPTKHFSTSNVSNSLIANGCLIKGTVNNSILSRRVCVEEGAEINNCIIMQGCKIKSNAKLSNIIIDKNNVVEENTELKGDINFPLVLEKRSLY